MPIAYHADSESGLVISAWLGAVTFDEIAEHLGKMAADPQWPTARRLLTDLRGVPVTHRPSTEQIGAAASAFTNSLGAQSEMIRWAIVAGHLFSKAMTFDALVRDTVRRLFVFQDLGTACAWMDLDRDHVEAVISGLSRGTAHAT
jgi:hypothetical protein